MKTHQAFLYLSVLVVLLSALLVVKQSSPTGGFVVKDYSEPQEQFAYTLHTKVAGFFNTPLIVFPQTACGTVAREMYEDIAFRVLDVSTGFENTASERIASVNFVTDRLRRYGTLDMVKGATLLQGYVADSIISINLESVVAVPKEQRANFFSMDLLGYTRDAFYVEKGRFSTPSFDCAFIRYNGDTLCECQAHPIRGIEVAGITGFAPDRDYYQEVIDRFEQRKNQTVTFK